MTRTSTSARQPALTPAFHRLRVSQVVQLCDDAVELAFDVPATLAESYAFAHGQHLAVRRVDGGEDLRRNYSITSALGDPVLRIGVRRVPDGRISGWLTNDVAIGDELEVMTPQGGFTAPLLPEGARHWLLVAAGSGITPLMSIARSVLAGEPSSSVTLLYGNRNVASIMFHEQIEDLKSEHLTRFAVHHFLSREQRNVPLFDGRLDGARMHRLASTLLDLDRVDEVFMCGPEPMTADLRIALADLGVTHDRVHVELFGTASSVPAPPPKADARVIARARVLLHGIESEIDVREGERVLDAAERGGLDVPYACKGGVCATCRAHISEGEVAMATNYALDDDEVAAGFALTCQSIPRSDRLVVDFDRR